MKEVKLKSIDPTKLFSVVKYAEKKGLSKGRISQKVHNGEIKVVRYNGGYLIYDK